MRTSGRAIETVVVAMIVVAGTWGMGGLPAAAQDALIERPGPPASDDLETDANDDRVPDGWYNARDAVLMPEGGVAGPHFLHFQADKTGRPARISRAFGIDGRKTEALVLGLWVRPKGIRHGERDGVEPCLLIDFLGDQLRIERHSMIGPWTWSSDRWTQVVKRLAVPPGTKDAIMTVGLMGATGTLDVDGLTFDLVPVGGAETTNLIFNGDFELGDPAPDSWFLENNARRIFPGIGSTSALELPRGRSRAKTVVALPVGRFQALDVSMAVSASALRGADGAGAVLFFLDDFGRTVPSQPDGTTIAQWSGSFPWHTMEPVRVPVPARASRAVLQIIKLDTGGVLRIDDVRVTAAPDAQAGAWVPYHDADETEDWFPVAPSPKIAPGGALDVSFLMPETAGGRGRFVTTKEGHLAFNKGGRARFLGVSLVAPTAFMEPERADALADRLARSGINLVRLGDLDTALGPERSLIDDTYDDTQHLDPAALSRLDHLIAALKKRGISVALELQSARLFRAGDGVVDAGALLPGGGPAYQLDPTIRKLALATARALLDHVNPETGLALRDDPVLAWVTLAGELSLFQQRDHPGSLPGAYEGTLRTLADKAHPGMAGGRLWEAVEAGQSRQMAEALRKDNLRVPIASVSAQRRDREFAQALAAPGLDLIDDRLFWFTRYDWAAPEHRTMIWSRDGGLLALAAAKRRPDRPYVVSQWCDITRGWSLPRESADLLLGVYMAATEDWDALVRRGVFLYPVAWGANATGTGGGEDIFQMPQILNGSPQLYALLPHAASLFFRPEASAPEPQKAAGNGQGSSSSRRGPRGGRRSGASPIPGWDPANGRLAIDTPFTQVLAGSIGRHPARLGAVEFLAENDFAVLAATAIGPEKIADARRLLVTAIARVEPTGFRWVHSWRHEVADPGRPPLLQEPVRARIVWKRKGTVRAFALDNTGERIGPVNLEVLPDNQGVALDLDGRKAGFHWELVAE